MKFARHLNLNLDSTQDASQHVPKLHKGSRGRRTDVKCVSKSRNNTKRFESVAQTR
jgi:hypothetical protein